MILTQCASCAAPLSLDAPKCVRCKTRYCNAACQRAHWKGGHKKTCEQIANGGGAERYHAFRKALEANTAAEIACAKDVPAGARCYFCGEDQCEFGAGTPVATSALVRGCSCRGTEGFVHSWCLAERARAECGGLATLTPWTTCRCCKQEYHGIVKCVLGWACWDANLNAADAELRCKAMTEFGIGLMGVDRHEEAFRVLDAAVGLQFSITVTTQCPHAMTRTQCYLAMCCSKLGRGTDKFGGNKHPHDGLTVMRLVFMFALEKLSTTDSRHLCAMGLAECLLAEDLIEEARRLLSDEYFLAARYFGNDHATTIGLSFQSAQAEYKMHFFGRDGYRGDLLASIKRHHHVHS